MSQAKQILCQVLNYTTQENKLILRISQFQKTFTLMNQK